MYLCGYFEKPPASPSHPHGLWIFPKKWADLVDFEELQGIKKHLKLYKLFRPGSLNYRPSLCFQGVIDYGGLQNTD